MSENRDTIFALVALAVAMGIGWFIFARPPDKLELQLPGTELDEELEVAPLGDEVLYDQRIKAGSKAHLLGKVETAIDEFTKAIEANPNGSDAYLNRGVAHQELGHWAEALADFEKARELSPGDPATWNNIAMLLAACPDDSIRDGDKAVQLAQKACELSDWKHPGMLNTLAVAYAEIGDWEAAVDLQEQAIEILGDAGPIVEDFRFALELFEQKKPYRIQIDEEE